jgi:tripartite-type tricarboxylate transporter receptor subunit TctC
MCGTIQNVRTTNDARTSKELKKLAAQPETKELSEEAKLFIQSYFPDELVALKIL